MGGILGIGSSALQADEQIMTAVGSDVANASTPGYRRQDVTLSEQEGGGVSASVGRVTDPALTNAILSALGGNGAATATSKVLTEAQDVFPGPSGADFGTALSAFWAAWQALADDPTSQPARQEVLSAAGVLATKFNSASLQLTQLQGQVTGEQASAVAQVNGLLQQIGALNKQIGATPAGVDRNTLENQQSGLVQQLAALVGVQGVRKSNGVLVLWNGGTEIVSASGGVESLTVPAGLPPEWVGSGQVATGGQAGGYQTAINDLQTYQTDLNGLANTVASDVNTGQANGYDLSGSPGQPLFIGAGAAGIGVSSTMTTNGLAASGTGAPGDGSNAQAIADLGGSGPGTIAAQLAADTAAVGVNVQQAQDQQQSAGQQLAGLKAAGQSVWGVSLNAAGVQMEEAQKAYQAAATWVATQGRMDDALMQAVARS